MIILKYGNAKKLESAKRWKCICSECGCKVILDKDDIQNYKNDTDSGGYRFTKFDWTCPYCEEELYYEEYDGPLVRITEPIKDKIEDFDRHYITEEELMADTKIELAHRLGVYCLQNNYIHFEEDYDPMHMTKRLTAYMRVASNIEEMVKVLKPDPILAIDMNKVRELSAGFNCYRRGE